MQQLECVTFLLTYNDVLVSNPTLPYEGINGKCNADRTDLTWNNFNIGEMLKDYGDYEFFNLRLSDVMLQNLSGYADATNLNVKYMLSGFDFVHQSYDIINQTEIYEVPICPFIESSETHSGFQNLNYTIRYKKGISNDIINLRLRVLRSLDNSTNTVTVSSAHARVHFIFNVFPIE